MPIHDIPAAPSPPFIDDTMVSRGQSPTRTDITFYVLVALVDTMRLHGIQPSDPVALTAFLVSSDHLSHLLFFIHIAFENVNIVA